jgi:hypothetical protein
MKLGTTTLILGVALTVVAGLFSSTIFGLIGTSTDAQSSARTAGLITGHVTTIHTDSDGNVLGYRQSDNLIVNGGENCALKMLFAASGGAASGNSVCTGANTAGFRWIAIGNTTNAFTAGVTPGSPLSTDTKLGNPHNSTSYGLENGLARKFGVVGATGWTNSTSSSSSGTASVVMSATFTNLASAARIVNESGLFNATDGNHQTDAMFAKQVFSGISLNPNDSLTVQWTINIGGTSSITG